MPAFQRTCQPPLCSPDVHARQAHGHHHCAEAEGVRCDEGWQRDYADQHEAQLQAHGNTTVSHPKWKVITYMEPAKPPVNGFTATTNHLPKEGSPGQVALET